MGCPISHLGTEKWRDGVEESGSWPTSYELSLRLSHGQWQTLFSSGLLAQSCPPHTDLVCRQCTTVSEVSCGEGIRLPLPDTVSRICIASPPIRGHLTGAPGWASSGASVEISLLGETVALATFSPLWLSTHYFVLWVLLPLLPPSPRLHKMPEIVFGGASLAGKQFPPSMLVYLNFVCCHA